MLWMAWLSKTWPVLIGFAAWAVGGAVHGTLLFADTSGIPDNIAPWATTGLAGLILAWLFFWHLPSKDKQLADLLAGKDKQVGDQATSKDKQIGDLIAARDSMVRELIVNTTAADKERRSDFRTALDLVVGHCEKESSKRDDAMKVGLDEHSKALCDLRETMEQMRDALLKLDRLSSK